MKNRKNVIGWALGLLSVFLVFEGAPMFVRTSGTVQGSEFSMLITIVNQISLGMMWLALFVAWKLVPIVRGNVCESNDFID